MGANSSAIFCTDGKIRARFTKEYCFVKCVMVHNGIE